MYRSARRARSARSISRSRRATTTRTGGAAGQAAEPAAAADAFRDGPLAEAEVESDPEPADGYLSGDGAEYDFGPHKRQPRDARRALGSGVGPACWRSLRKDSIWFRDELAGRVAGAYTVARGRCASRSAAWSVCRGTPSES